MILTIDTTDQKLIKVTLEKEGSPREAGKKIKSLIEENVYGSQVLLPLIKKIVKDSGFSLSDISEVKVNTGPGSFTGIRVGVSVANALGYSLGIPVNGKSLETQLKY